MSRIPNTGFHWYGSCLNHNIIWIPGSKSGSVYGILIRIQILQLKWIRIQPDPGSQSCIFRREDFGIVFFIWVIRRIGLSDLNQQIKGLGVRTPLSWTSPRSKLFISHCFAPNHSYHSLKGIIKEPDEPQRQCWGSVTCWCGSGSVPLANGSVSGSGFNSGSDSFLRWLWECKENFFTFFLYNLPTGTSSQILC